MCGTLMRQQRIEGEAAGGKADEGLIMRQSSFRRRRKTVESRFRHDFDSDSKSAAVRSEDQRTFC